MANRMSVAFLPRQENQMTATNPLRHRMIEDMTIRGKT